MKIVSRDSTARENPKENTSAVVELDPSKRTTPAASATSPCAEQTAIIIPCYKVADHIVALLESIPEELAARIYIVDDRCPQGSGKLVQDRVKDPRVVVLFNPENLGVGGTVKRGFTQAAIDGYTYLVKMDGDGQMDPQELPKLVRPIHEGLADYTKGNRFFNPRALKGMPAVRVIGNGALSFMTKLSSGYWHLMDPTNGYVAIHAKVFQMLELDKIENRFFFETDMLCRLHLLGAVALDVPIPARYGEEESNLKIGHTIFSFSSKHFSRFFRRIIYDYFVHDFNIGSVQLVGGLILFGFGFPYGIYNWIEGKIAGTPTEIGVIMIAVLTTLLGFQLLLSALNYDVSRRSHMALHKLA